MKIKKICLLLSIVGIASVLTACNTKEVVEDNEDEKEDIVYGDFFIEKPKMNPNASNTHECTSDKVGNDAFCISYKEKYSDLLDLSYDDFLNQYDAIRVTYIESRCMFQYIYEPKTENKWYYEAYGVLEDDKEYYETTTKAIMVDDEYVVTTDLKLNKYDLFDFYATGDAKFTSTLKDDDLDYILKREIHDLCCNDNEVYLFTLDSNVTFCYNDDYSYVYSYIKDENGHKRSILVQEDGLTKYLFNSRGFSLKVEYFNHTLIDDKINTSGYNKCEFYDVYHRTLKYHFGYAIYNPYSWVGQIFSFQNIISNLEEKNSFKDFFEITSKNDIKSE